MPNVLLVPLAVVVLLGGLIFVHELGHFLVAKAVGVKVLRFSIGFGPPLFSFRRGETEYWLAYLPLGGYVKMAGQEPGAEVAPEDRGRGFFDQAPWKRLLISAAGPAMNILLPLAILFGIAVSENGTDTPAAVVGTAFPGLPAARAGLKPGDRILSVTTPDGTFRLRSFIDLQSKVTPHPGATLTFEVERGGERLAPLAIRTEVDESSDALGTVRRGFIGVAPLYAQATVAPVAPGAAGPVEPLDVVTAVDGKPVRNSFELTSALDAAACRPVDLELLRERPRVLPGAYLGDYARERFTGVPTCRDGAPTLRIADPWVSATIAAVEPGSPAAAAGIRRGDVITALDGNPVRSARDLQALINKELGDGGSPAAPGEPPRFKEGTLTLADGRTVRVTPIARTEQDELTGKDRVVPVLGIYTDRRALADEAALRVPQVKLDRRPLEIFSVAWAGTTSYVRMLVVGVVGIFNRSVPIGQMGGVIRIVQETQTAVKQGFFFKWMAFISINLAVLNLLPIPVFDGGNIVQSLAEMITRRPLSTRMREVANAVGLVVILSLLVFTTFNDLWNGLFKPPPPVAGETRR